MSFEPGNFYITICPPGNAAGASDWDAYADYGSPGMEDEIDPNYDEDGNPRPLDWFFNDY